LLILLLATMTLLALVMLVNYFIGRQLSLEIIKISQAGEPLTFYDLDANSRENITGDSASRYYTEALLDIKPANLKGLALINTFYRKSIMSLPAEQLPDELRENVRKVTILFQSALEKLDKGAELPLYGFDIGIKQIKQHFFCKFFFLLN